MRLSTDGIFLNQMTFVSLRDLGTIVFLDDVDGIQRISVRRDGLDGVGFGYEV